jgi:hypothetical protein
LGEKLISHIRELADQLYKQMMSEDMLRHGDYDSEQTQIELNRFLSWIGAKKPIADKLGWDHLFPRYRGKGNPERTPAAPKTKGWSKQESLRLSKEDLKKALTPKLPLKPLRGQNKKLAVLDDYAFFDVENGHPCEKCGKPLRKMPSNYRGRSPKCEHCGYQDMKK